MTSQEIYNFINTTQDKLTFGNKPLYLLNDALEFMDSCASYLVEKEYNEASNMYLKICDLIEHNVINGSIEDIKYIFNWYHKYAIASSTGNDYPLVDEKLKELIFKLK